MDNWHDWEHLRKEEKDAMMVHTKLDYRHDYVDGWTENKVYVQICQIDWKAFPYRVPKAVLYYIGWERSGLNQSDPKLLFLLDMISSTKIFLNAGLVSRDTLDILDLGGNLEWIINSLLVKVEQYCIVQDCIVLQAWKLCNFKILSQWSQKALIQLQSSSCMD